MYITLSIYMYVSNGILLSHKKNENLPFVTWMDLEGIMLRELSQTEKDKYCVLSLKCRIYKIKQVNVTKKKQTHEYKEQTGYPWRGEGGGNIEVMIKKHKVLCIK